MSVLRDVETGDEVASLKAALAARGREVAEANEREAASANVLNIISTSPGDAKPAFEAILENATRICGAKFANLFLYDKKDDAFRVGALHNAPAAYAERWAKNPVLTVGENPRNPLARLVKSKRVVNIPDLMAEPGYLQRDPRFVTLVEAARARTHILVPMLKDDELVGAIAIYRQEVQPFADKQLALLSSFAAQAVIAIENTRLLGELRESLSQQTATADVLKVISRETFDLQAVLNTLVESAATLCEAYDCIVYLHQGDKLHVKALYGPIGAGQTEYEIRRGWVAGRSFLDRVSVHVHDLSSSEEFPEGREMAHRRGHRTILAVPLFRGEEAIGVISIRRFEVKPFTDKQIELVKTFADQAVIAIENVRLFEAEQQRTNELRESLDRHTATAEILKVIASSPTDVRPVFDAIAENAMRLFAGQSATVTRVVGDEIQLAALTGGNQAGIEAVRSSFPTPLSASGIHSRVARSGAPAFRTDIETDPEVSQGIRETARSRNYRSILVVPMLRDGKAIGTIGVTRREPTQFTETQIGLLTTFADQAVIAIENVRLFDEVHEALEQQTATSEVLGVISSSPGDLQPVFNSMLENASRICEAKFGVLYHYSDGAFYPGALVNAPPAYVEFVEKRGRFRPQAGNALDHVLQTKSAIRSEDVSGESVPTPSAKLAGARSQIIVPMLKEDELIGAIAIYRQEVRAFTDKQVALLTNFAAQAVIAIENTRLLNELRESLAQQTATSEVLQVISSSPGELAPVFEAMLDNATRICEANLGNLFLYEGHTFRAVAVHGDSQYADWTRRDPVVDMSEAEHFGVPLHRVTRTKTLVHIPDIRLDESYIGGNARIRSLADTAGARTHLVVPMLKDDELIGAIVMYRQEVRPFSDKQIALVQNFAAQAVIAIENTRLLSELRESLERQTATSEVLQVISSSPGDLEPVFNTMLAKATELCGASYGTMWLRDGDVIRVVAYHGELPADFAELWRAGSAIPSDSEAPIARTIRSGEPIYVEDLREDQGYRKGNPLQVAAADIAGIRTLVAVPLLKEGGNIGGITIYRREVRPFSEKQIELVSNFAAQAVIAIENTRLLNELRQRTDDLTESLEQQTATSEVLQVISSSRGELAPVFEAMLENATRICGAKFGNLFLREGDAYRAVAVHGEQEYIDYYRQSPLMNLREHPNSPLNRLTRTKEVVHIADMRADPAYAVGDWRMKALVEAAGARTLLCVPMHKDNEIVGVIAIYRQDVNPFAEKQIDLVKNFAAQAVIAIENTRLLNELRERTDDLTESLEQQTATSEVLKVISSSPGELEPVFQALLENAVRICRAQFGVMHRFTGEAFAGVATLNIPPVLSDYLHERGLAKAIPGSDMDSLYKSKRVVHTIDMLTTATPAPPAKLAGARTQLAVPMLKDDELIGAIVIYRTEVQPFSEKQIELVANFAAQAVIAIENARLLSELRQRTDDLTQSLEYQTATSEILTVISRSPTDAMPVFDIIGERAEKLCDADVSVVSMVDGELIRLASIHGVSSEGVEAVRSLYPLSLERQTITSRTARAAAVVHVADVLADPTYDTKGAARAAGYRGCLGVPMMRDGQVIGTIFVGRRDPRPYTDNQIQLLKTFADQAVIAIGNVRLFEEVQARTEELTESLEYQTAISEILAVISSSPSDVMPVLKAVGERAARICEAWVVDLVLVEGDFIRVIATVGDLPRPASSELVPLNRETVMGRSICDMRPVQVADLQTSEEFPLGRELARKFGHHTILGVPLIREGKALGTILVRRDEVKLFEDKHVALLKTFADQAAIAIENVRLFEEVRARTEDLAESLQQQTATADVLKIISRSAFDLKTVLDTLLRSAARLCEADQGTITQRMGDRFYRSVAFGYPQEFMDYVKDKPVEMNRDTGTGRALLDSKVIHIPDVAADSDYKWTDAQRLGGYRAMLGVPMLREREPIGVLTLTRKDARAFTDKQIELVTTFADQAAIAIENVRLFEEIQEKSRQLEEASKHKSQFLANMSHELRTPLNAILGYTELIADGVYGDTPEKVQATLKRVITNGKHLLGLINDVLDLSKIEAGQLTLSLADYSMKDVVHNVFGAVEPLAAEKKLNFKVEIAPDLPLGHGDERRLTQVLLNLVGNSIKFTDDGNVIIQASLKDGMFCVAVRDTGPGISEDDQKKLFQEFQQADSSTTKKKGGTGLGLAISKRIIEMHGGRIWLESKLGAGSTFTFMVPVRAEQAKRAT